MYNLPLEFNSQELLTFIIAVGGFLGTILLLVLNLKVGWAMQAMKAEMAHDLGKIEIQVANLRTEAANNKADLYQRVMDNVGRMYAARETQETMHRANTQRLDSIEDDVKALAQKIGDIS